MVYSEGETLEDKIGRLPLPIKEALKIGLDHANGET